MSDAPRPRVRVQAGSDRGSGPTTTHDNFLNVAANLGYGTNNLSSGSSYGFNPLTRNRMLLEWMYRGSWIVRKVVDCPADDMTREGIDIESDMPPDQIDGLTQYWDALQIWQRINSALKWARLYGGCILVIMIDGQDTSEPLRLDTIGRGQFKGLIVLDRWMVWPQNDLVKEPGPNFGKPIYYEVVADARSVPRMTVHYSRVIRFDGAELPYWQSMAENYWSLSVIEPLWDRLIAFDSATQGAAQLIYKAHLRVLKLPGYRNLIAGGGQLYQAVMRQLQLIRMMQTIEGMTVIDGDDTFDALSYSFVGLSEMIIQFGQQLSGAADVPMTRMFGQSPAGMNSTGDSDLRNYYDGIRSRQEFGLRRVVTRLLDITHRSAFGKPLPDGFNYSFSPLWQLQPAEKATIATQTATATEQLLQSNIFDLATAMKEIRQASRLTGFGSNITDEAIEEAKAAPPPMPMQPGMGGMPGQPGGTHGTQPPGPPGPTGQPPVGGGQGGEMTEEDDAVRGQQPMPVQPVTQHPANAFAKLVAKSKIWRKQKTNGTEQLNGKHHLNGHAPPEEDTDDDADITHGANVNIARGHTTHINLPASTRVVLHDRQRSIVDVGGLQVVIETEKGERRTGYGWSISMPAHYGYISGTNSAEGAQEQFDAFVGPNLESNKVWIIEQQNPDTRRFDEHKAMLGYDSKEDAVADYTAAFSDGRGADRIANVRSMDIATFRSWLEKWKYGEEPPKATDTAQPRDDK